jgi:hypothetical protein
VTDFNVAWFLIGDVAGLVQAATIGAIFGGLALLGRRRKGRQS